MVEQKNHNRKVHEKIIWYASGLAKLGNLVVIFVLCAISGGGFYLLLKSYTIFEVAIVLSFLFFFFLVVVVVILINKYRILERLTDDWYQKKWYSLVNNQVIFYTDKSNQ